MSATSAIAARAVVDVPATAGELLQGVDPVCGPRLVSLPVARVGRTVVTLRRDPGIVVRPHRERAATALRAALERAGWRGGARADLDTSIPPGRGWGSSTVDVAGVILGVAHACGGCPGAALLARHMAAVEPSDGSPMAGLWLVDHVGGSAAAHLGPAPPAHVVVVDEGAAVDTAALHRGAGPGAAMPAGETRRLASAVAVADLGLIGEIATRSALRNEERLPNASLQSLIAVRQRLRLPGVVVAHSGSLAGILAADPVTADEAAAALRARGHTATILAVTAPGATVQVSPAAPR